MPRKLVPATVTYKAKVREMLNAADAVVPYVDFKRTLSRRDCDLKPHTHDYYNSDLFPAMLNGAYRAAIGNREWCELSALPAGVTVDTSGFLATVTVRLEV